jgi:transcriptional regulator with XRE-family HTH domain
VTEHATLAEFLRNRRARISPADAGLPTGTGRRQTSGLRREELATLAGMSVDYYTRLEQGRDTNPGPGVLNALAAALLLDVDERAHLYALAGAAPPLIGAGAGAAPPLIGAGTAPRVTGAGIAPNGADRAAGEIRPGLRQLLRMVSPAPAYVIDALSNVLEANAQGWQLMAGLDAWPASRRNIIRYVFTHPGARQIFESWPEIAADCVADLRSVATALADQSNVDSLVRELSVACPEFADLWLRYDVRVNRGGRRVFRHPTWGRCELTSEILTAADGQRFLVFQPGADAAMPA